MVCEGEIVEAWRMVGWGGVGEEEAMHREERMKNWMAEGWLAGAVGGEGGERER
jgi:hypothetical protein